MRMRIPLFGKVLFWFVLNLLVIAALVYAFARAQFQIGLEWLLAGESGHRLEAMAEVITGDLRERPVEQWGEVLARYEAAHQVTVALFRNDGRQIAGTALDVPPDVGQKLRDRRGPPAERERDGGRPAPGHGESQLKRGPPPARVDFFIRAGTPARYWAGIHIGVTHADAADPRPVTLVLVGETITGGGLFVPPRPWLTLIGVALLVSAIVWLPLIAGITRAIRRLNNAARTIADGRFDVRLPARGRDELGELAASVNTMAERLAAMVDSQRRFTADVAHELCSPIARMQRAVGVVEQRANAEISPYVAKLEQELQHMAKLVEEVLSFAKSTTPPSFANAERVDVAELIREVQNREAAEADLCVDVPPGLVLQTLREPLDRAIANVLRNAVRYAGHAGAIELTARNAGTDVEIAVRDHGPGVPAESLEKLFEPFYRPDLARDRRTGGAGLGLAIVKRCVELCGGAVRAELPEGGGMRVVLRVPAMKGNR